MDDTLFFSFSLENATVSNEILNSVRKTVKTYPFNFSRPLQQARIISGEEEGHNSWITANYLIGTFGNVSLKIAVIFFHLYPTLLAEIPLTLPMLRLLSSKIQGHKDLWKTI